MSHNDAGCALCFHTACDVAPDSPNALLIRPARDKTSCKVIREDSNKLSACLLRQHAHAVPHRKNNALDALLSPVTSSCRAACAPDDLQLHCPRCVTATPSGTTTGESQNHGISCVLTWRAGLAMWARPCNAPPAAISPRAIPPCRCQCRKRRARASPNVGVGERVFVQLTSPGPGARRKRHIKGEGGREEPSGREPCASVERGVVHQQTCSTALERAREKSAVWMGREVRAGGCRERRMGRNTGWQATVRELRVR